MNVLHSRKTVYSWALYDFANSSFPTIIGTFIYATFFTQVIAENEIIGTAQWSRVMTITGLTVAILSPYVGAIADQGRLRKPFLIICIFIASLGAVGLFFPVQGDMLLALSIFGVAHVAYEMGNVFYNAYLPDIAPSSRIGRVSGLGFFMGYVGGILCLLIALFGFVQTDDPLLGFSKIDGENVRATNLVVAVWFIVFSLPILTLVRVTKDRTYTASRRVISEANRQILSTLSQIRYRYRQILRFLIARMLYNDGLVTIFAFGGIYAAGTFGFSFEDVIIFGIALNIAAGIGAYAFGFLDDLLGGKTTIIVTLSGLLAFAALGVFAPSPTWFWVAGIGAGLMVGPNQAASRSLMGRFTPSKKENEFFGLYALSGKATAFLGPMLMGVTTLMFDSQRYGMAMILLFFGAGLVLMLFVDEKAGMSAAKGA